MANQDKLVTAALITCNREAYLRNAIESVLAQTYKNFEFIIADNASTDGTESICREYAAKDKRIRYVRHKENIGGMANFNFVLGAARGEYFCYLGDDDVWAPRFLETCAGQLNNHPKAVLASTNFAYFHHDDGRLERRDSHYYWIFDKDLYTRLKKFILLYISDGKGNMFCGVWRRSMIADMKVGTGFSHDVAFLFEALSKGTAEFTDKELFYKGIMPWREPPRSFTFTRIYRALENRLSSIPYSFSNARHIMKLSGLSPWQKTKLLFWNLFVALRFIVWRKV